LYNILFWALVPRDCTFPIWTTLAATLNAEKYGHVFAVAGGFLAQIAEGRMRQRTVTEAR
jgi:hypothetical protein